ncbi:hypothetical protein [Actinoplanes sp. CA-252034]|uniref:hypothetical protein n=1 Tax=Actinoplanes sp. CA-252034 TaxID=3239906 RepID=UPI003D9785BC
MRRPVDGPSPGEFLLSWAESELRDGLRGYGRPFEIFGQGSRVNGTHLDHDSDIDLVLMLTEPGAGPLTESGVGLLTEPGARWQAFRDDVLAVLGESHVVRMGRRCLNVDDPDSLFAEMVDILVATEHRWSPDPGSGHYEQGVFFHDLQGRPIVNFPKQHRRNGDAKDLRTGGRFKETVRTVKRARRWAERHRLLDDGAAPSYLLECLLFNVPDLVYRAAPGAAHREAVAWLRHHFDEAPESFAALPCQNGINRLFGPGPDQWEPGAAARIIDVLHQI